MDFLIKEERAKTKERIKRGILTGKAGSREQGIYENNC